LIFTEVIIILLLTIVVSNIVDSAFPRLPLPLILIVFGALLSLTAVTNNLKLEPEIFMALLVAPLLFRESEEADFGALWRVRKAVILMAFLLVFITVFAVGFSVKAIVPAVPLAACFALGAILGPTDAIAVVSISSRVDIDDGLMTILKGEGLINDASGVIAFRFAVAALLTGNFSFGEAALEFFLVSVGGFLAGLVIAQLKLSVMSKLKRLEIRNNAAYMLIEVITPFVCYFLAEEIGVSGIIAAVTAGIRQSLHVDHVDRYQAEFSIFKKSIWQMLTITFNSIVFLLLGLQLPGIVRDVLAFPGVPLIYVLLIGLFVTAMVLAVRFVSSLIFSGRAIASAAGASAAGAADDSAGGQSKARQILGMMRHSLILTLSGVKGTVSLATAFSLPFYFVKGEDFPQRPFLLLITATVIITSLLLAVIILPRIAKKQGNALRNEKRIIVLNKVLDELHPDSVAYSNAIVMNVNQRIKELAREDMKPKERKELKRLMELEYNIEKDLIDEKRAAGEMSENDYQTYLRLLAVMHKLTNKPLTGGIGMRSVFFRGGFDGALRGGKKHAERKAEWRKMHGKERAEVFEAMWKSLDSVKNIFWDNTSFIIEELRAQEGAGSSAAVSEVVSERIDMANRVVSHVFGGVAGAQFHDDYDKELLGCYTLERAVIDKFEAEGLLECDEADAMRVDVNMLETYTIEDKHRADIVKLLAAVSKRRGRKRHRR
jgi:CPA1 family monovalent cation:H+ antiporter